MSPKKTPRGGRYTTRVNRDGSQEYGRRGCFSMLLMIVFIAGGTATAVVVGGFQWLVG